jgi:undecaprenyl-diphosphatase
MDAPTIEMLRSTTDAVAAWPDPAQVAVEVLGEAGLVALGLLFLLATWRAWRRRPEALAVALLAGAGTIVAYGMSEALKSSERQPRPCQALPDVETFVTCPPAGDWSLPSNHATIAAALAAAVVALAPRLAVVAVPVALVVASARVALGVHFLHDVLTGLALGGVVVACAALGATRVTRRPWS